MVGSPRLNEIVGPCREKPWWTKRENNHYFSQISLVKTLWYTHLHCLCRTQNRHCITTFVKLYWSSPSSYFSFNVSSRNCLKIWFLQFQLSHTCSFVHKDIMIWKYPKVQIPLGRKKPSPLQPPPRRPSFSLADRSQEDRGWRCWKVRGPAALQTEKQWNLSAVRLQEISFLFKNCMQMKGHLNPTHLPFSDLVFDFMLFQKDMHIHIYIIYMCVCVFYLSLFAYLLFANNPRGRRRLAPWRSNPRSPPEIQPPRKCSASIFWRSHSLRDHQMRHCPL